MHKLTQNFFRLMGAHGAYCSKGTRCNMTTGNDADQIEIGKLCTNFKNLLKIDILQKKNFRIFLSLRFYVKSIFDSRNEKLLVFCYKGLSVNFVDFFGILLF